MTRFTEEYWKKYTPPRVQIQTGLSCTQEIGSVFVFYTFGEGDAPCFGGEGIFHVIIIQILLNKKETGGSLWKN